MNIVIVTARFYEDIASEMESGAIAALQEAGATFTVEAVPGAFEIPAAIAFAHTSKKFDGYIALGCVIRGETSHYDYVCGESARGLMDLGLQQGCAIGYGILTVENEGQAWERASVSQGNKGRDAALACLRMIELKKHYS
jgi:6,7-dimethyl-8-ribityllumazine synthase